FRTWVAASAPAWTRPEKLVADLAALPRLRRSLTTLGRGDTPVVKRLDNRTPSHPRFQDIHSSTWRANLYIHSNAFWGRLCSPLVNLLPPIGWTIPGIFYAGFGGIPVDAFAYRANFSAAARDPAAPAAWEIRYKFRALRGLYDEMVPAVRRPSLALFTLVASLGGQSYYAPPAGVRPPMRRTGASVLPGGRIVAPLGDQYATGPGAFALAVSP